MDGEAVVEPGVGRAVAWLARQVELLLAEHGLTLAQYRFLTVLAERPSGASVLARQLGVSRPSVTAVADGLVARDLIDREGDSNDRRRITHVLTQSGLETVLAADAAIEVGIRAVIEHLDVASGRHVAAGFGALHELTTRISTRFAEDDS